MQGTEENAIFRWLYITLSRRKYHSHRSFTSLDLVSLCVEASQSCDIGSIEDYQASRSDRMSE